MKNVQVKRAQIDVIEKLLEALDDLRKDTSKEYKKVGKETKQATNWRTGELLWEDEAKTIPKYDDRYEYVDIPDEQMTDSKKALLQAISDMESKLDAMI